MGDAVQSFQIGQAAQLLGVSPDTVRRWVDSGRLPAERVNGRRQIDGDALARFAEENIARAEGATGRPSSVSNRFLGLVTNVVKDRVVAQVEIVCGPYRVVALVTREAAEALDLAPGTLTVASVNASDVSLELAEDL